jgi:hypothetical protein
MVDYDWPWYKVVDSSMPLVQGDILPNCPCIALPLKDENGQFIEIHEDEDVKIVSDPDIFDNAIIITQTCDIADGDVKFVQLCPIWPLLYYYSQIELELDEEDRNSWPGNVQADRMFGYTTINECKEDGFKSEPMVIEFFRTFFVPLDFLQHRYVIPDNKRLRLLPPYREKVAQAYASFIMRVSIENNRIQKKYKFKKHIENGVENFEFIDKDAHATKYVLTKKLLENGDENYKLTDLTSNEVIYNITNNVTD